MPPDHQKQEGQIDERFVDEWIEFGFAEIVIYLAKHANFYRWCVEHHREELAQDG